MESQVAATELEDSVSIIDPCKHVHTYMCRHIDTHTLFIYPLSPLKYHLVRGGLACHLKYHLVFILAFPVLQSTYTHIQFIYWAGA